MHRQGLTFLLSAATAALSKDTTCLPAGTWASNWGRDLGKKMQSGCTYRFSGGVTGAPEASGHTTVQPRL